MKVDAWDYRILDIAKACQTFIKESSYPIEYNEQNTARSLWSALNDPDSELIVDYTGTEFNGFAIVQRENAFHTEYFGFLNKFYVLPERRLSRAGFRLIGEATGWFDMNECALSFATATAEIGKNAAFVKLMLHAGYTMNDTGILTRKQHE